MVASRLRWPALRLASLVIIAFFSFGAVPAVAQTSGGARPSGLAESSVGFFTAYRFHLNGVRTRNNGDHSFAWDTDVGADLDVFDLGVIRGNLHSSFESIVGDERRAVDPNQNNYTIDLSVFVRLPRGELGTTFHHVSRHLSDRQNSESVAWNMVGLGYSDLVRIGGFEIGLGSRVLRTVERSGADYETEFTASIRLMRAIHDRVAIIVDMDGTAVSVDANIYGRPTQYGGRLEGGLRFRGGAGAVEVFIGSERRIDADPFDRRPIRWMQMGFRFVVG